MDFLSGAAKCIDVLLHSANVCGNIFMKNEKNWLQLKLFMCRNVSVCRPVRDNASHLYDIGR